MQVITKLKLKMRTKHILTAMVLPALFAACTADDFETVNVAGDSQRPMLSGVTLTTVDGADTRYAVEEGAAGLKFNYENGDQIGAAIIDQFDENNPKDPSKWDIIPSQGGVCNPFTYDATAGTWTTINSIGVGHYIFVYPYNSTNILRNAVNYELPVIQELYTDEEGDVDLNAAIEKGNMAIYSTLLEEKDLNVEAYMRNMFAYPTFRINIDNGEKVSTVSQVVLEYTGNSNKGFVVKSGLAHEKVYNLFTDNEKSFLDKKTETTDWSKVQTSDLILGENDKAYVADGEIGYSKYIIAKLPKNTEFKRDGNTENKYIDVRFMIPGEAIEMYDGTNTTDGGELNLYIYTDNGILTLKDIAGEIDWKKTTDKETQKLIFTRNSSYTLTLKKDNVKDGEDNYIVTTVDDWNNLVSEYGKSKNFVDTPLKVQVIGNDFAFGTDTEMPEVAIFEVTTPVSVKSDVTLSNVHVTNKSVLTVEEGATLTTGEGFEAYRVNNEGAMVITPAYDEDDEIVNYEGVARIANNGKLTIKEDAEATFMLYNEEEGVVENNGEITIENIAKDKGNHGVINNNGVINTTGFANAAREYADNYEEGDEAINTPTINNNKGAKILSKSGELLNNALIVNKGTITCKNEAGTIVNGADKKNVPAEIDATEAVLTYITENANGKIIVASATTTNLTIGNGEQGIIELTTDKASESFKNSLVNAVIAAKDFTVTDGDINTLTLTGDAKVTLGKEASVEKALNVEAGTVTLASDMTVETVNVAEDAQITVPEDITLTVTGASIDNQGIILVGGAFVAKSIDAADGGQVEDNGNGEITWAPTSVDKLKDAYQTALNAAVKAWASDTRSNLKLGVANLNYDILNGVKGSGDEAIKAADLFEDYYGANNADNKEDEQGVSFAAQNTLKKEFEAYQAANKNAKLLDGYKAAVENLLTKDKEVLAFLEGVEENLTWDAPTDQTAGAARIYKDTKDAAGKTVTAATNAINAFKSAVATSTAVKYNGSPLSSLQGVVLCTSSENYAPACSQVFTDSPIYLIFGEDAIAMTQDWTKAGLSRPCKTKDNADGWGLENVKSWIEEVAASDSNSTFIKNARNYVETNDLISKSKSWTYDNNIIKAIVADQEYNK